MAQLTPEIIDAAIDGFENQKRRIDEQIAELRSMLNGNAARQNAAPKQGRRRMSAEARSRIAEAQRRRWAASKGEAAPAPAPSKRKRKLSAAGRAAIVAALKKRWAAKKAGSATATSTKKVPVTKTVKAKRRAAAKNAAAKTTPTADSATA